MIGRIAVDFAGTREEAIEFARKNGLHVSASNPKLELPQLTLPFTSIAKRKAASAKFTELGWDEGSQTIIRWKRKAEIE